MLTHSLTCSLGESSGVVPLHYQLPLTHSLTHSLTHPLTHPLTHSHQPLRPPSSVSLPHSLTSWRSVTQDCGLWTVDCAPTVQKNDECHPPPHPTATPTHSLFSFISSYSRLRKVFPLFSTLFVIFIRELQHFPIILLLAACSFLVWFGLVGCWLLAGPPSASHSLPHPHCPHSD